MSQRNTENKRKVEANFHAPLFDITKTEKILLLCTTSLF